MSGMDRALFHWLNRTMADTGLDPWMLFVTNWRNWSVLLAVAVLYLVLARGRRGRVVVLVLVAAVGLADTTASQLIKPAVHRPRPCHAGIEARVVGRCGGRNGFPSNHAANVAAATAVMGTFYPVTLAVMLPVGLVIGVSRVYLGVHYPGDVLAGYLLGAAFGLILARWVPRMRWFRLPDC